MKQGSKKSLDYGKLIKTCLATGKIRLGFHTLTPTTVKKPESKLLSSQIVVTPVYEKSLLIKARENDGFAMLVEDLVKQIIYGMVDQNGCNAIMVTIFRLYPEMSAEVNLPMIVQNAYLEKQRREHPPIKMVQNEYNDKVDTVSNTIDLETLRLLINGGQEID